MSDRMGDEMARGGSALMGFVAGAMVGAGLALLFAPASGAETRKKLGQAAGRMRDGVGEQIHNAKDQLGHAKERVTDQLGHAKERVTDQIGSAKERFGELKSDVNAAIDSGREAFRSERDSRSESTSSKRTT